MDSPDADRRATRAIGGLRTIPADVLPGSVLTVRADRTFGWMPPMIPDGVQRALPKGTTNGQVWTWTPQGGQWAAPVPPVFTLDFRDGIAVPAMLSLLGLSASVDVPVTWITPFPDTTYSILKPQVTATSASLIGKTDAVVKAGSVTKTGCTVTVTTTAVLAAGTCTLSLLALRRA